MKYVPVRGNVVSVYLFIEGNQGEEFWMDSQNCEYHLYCSEFYDEKTGLFCGKNWWLLWPCVPEGTEDFTKVKVKWYVDDSSVNDDVGKEWDLKKHKVKK